MLHHLLFVWDVVYVSKLPKLARLRLSWSACPPYGVFNHLHLILLAPSFAHMLLFVWLIISHLTPVLLLVCSGCFRDKIFCCMRNRRAKYGDSAESNIWAVHGLCSEKPVLWDGDADQVRAVWSQPSSGDPEGSTRPSRSVKLKHENTTVPIVWLIINSFF